MLWSSLIWYEISGMFATGSSGFGMSPVSVSSLMLGPRARITTWIPASKCVAISSFFFVSVFLVMKKQIRHSVLHNLKTKVDLNAERLGRGWERERALVSAVKSVTVSRMFASEVCKTFL